MTNGQLLKNLRQASQAVANASRTVGARREVNNAELKTAVFQLAMASQLIIQVLEELLKKE